MAASSIACEVFSTPFDVILTNQNVVQPDLAVIRDPKKITKRGGEGAPDMIIEIVSPSTGTQDRLRKLNLYLRFGVREYWIADQEEATVSVHLLKDGEYFIKAYGSQEHIPVTVLDRLSIDMKLVFPEEAAQFQEE